jgi:hypothetical protein
LEHKDQDLLRTTIADNNVNIHSSVDGHTGWFYNLAIVSSACSKYGCASISILSWLWFFGFLPWSGMAGP